MPYKGFTKGGMYQLRKVPPKRAPRKYRRKRYARKKSRLSSQRTVKLGMVPDRMFVTLKYSDRYTVAGGAGTLGLQRFKVNSVFDPDLTGAGHQPLYRDTFLGNSGAGPGLYKRYRVHAVDYVIRLCNTDTNTEQSVAIAAIPHAQNFASTDDFDAVCERYKAQRCILSGNTAGHNVKVFKGSVMVKHVEGLKTISNEENLTAVAGVDPVWIPEFAIIVESMAEGSATNTLADVTLYYKVELYDKLYRNSTD